MTRCTLSDPEALRAPVPRARNIASMRAGARPTGCTEMGRAAARRLTKPVPGSMGKERSNTCARLNRRAGHAGAAAELYAGELPAPVCYQGTMHPERVEAAVAARIGAMKDDFRTALRQMLGRRRRVTKSPTSRTARRRFSVTRMRNARRVQLRPQSRRQADHAADNVRALMDSIIQDLDQIPMTI